MPPPLLPNKQPITASVVELRGNGSPGVRLDSREIGLDGANDDPEIDSADPFGIREMNPETEAVDRVIAKARRQSVKKRWSKAGKSFRKGFGVAQESSRAFLTRSPYVIGWNNHAANSPPELEDEEVGSRKAIGMVNSWNRAELLTNYFL